MKISEIACSKEDRVDDKKEESAEMKVTAAAADVVVSPFDDNVDDGAVAAEADTEDIIENNEKKEDLEDEMLLVTPISSKEEEGDGGQIDNKKEIDLAAGISLKRSEQPQPARKRKLAPSKVGTNGVDSGSGGNKRMNTTIQIHRCQTRTASIAAGADHRHHPTRILHLRCTTNNSSSNIYLFTSTK